MKFTKDHEWVELTGDVALVGITAYAANALGDVVFVEVPEAGKALKKGDSFAVVESVKAASDVYAPVSGEVVEANTELPNSPDLVNAAPEGAGWTTFADDDDGLVVPSGIALHRGLLYVADNATSTVTAFDLDGNVKETLVVDVEEGGLMGIRITPDGTALYAVDFAGDRVLRASPLGSLE